MSRPATQTEANKPNKKQPSERKRMNNKFDELTKSMAQSVTRRAALKRFGVGLAGMALACFGLVNKGEAAQGGNCKPSGTRCTHGGQCCSGVCWALFKPTVCM